MQLLSLALSLYLSALIITVIHEGGHYIAARMAGFKVKAIIFGYAFFLRNNLGDVKLWPIIGFNNPKGLSIGFSLIPFGGNAFFGMTFNEMLKKGKWRVIGMAAGGIILQLVGMFLTFFAGLLADGFMLSDIGEALYLTGRSLVLLPAIVFDLLYMSVTGQAGLFFNVDPQSSTASARSFWDNLKTIFIFSNVFLIYINLLPIKGMDGHFMLEALRGKRRPE